MGQIIASAMRRKLLRDANKMGTRALIGKLQDGKVRFIYNQSDGYVEHLGEILVNHYNDSSRVDSLLELGDITRLDSSLEKTKADYVRLYTSYDKKTGERIDRAETAREYGIIDFIADIVDGNEYFYLWDNKTWWVCLGSERGWYAMRDNMDIQYLMDYYDKFIIKKYGRLQ